MEFGVNVGNSFSSMSGRNAFVGLAGGFGTFLIGRHDTPVKISTGKLDLFADTVGDNNNYGLISDLRVDGAMAYVSPSFNGLTFAAANVSHPAGSEDFSDAISIAGMYSNGPIYISGGYEHHQTGEDKNLGASIASILGNSGADKQFRVGLGLMDWNGFTVTFVYEGRKGIGMQDGSANPANNDDGWDTDAYVLSGAFKFTPNDQVKAMYGNLSGDNANSGSKEEVNIDHWALGYQHNLSARTDAQVVYTASSEEDKDTGFKGTYDEDILSF
jgi:predicted porin